MDFNTPLLISILFSSTVIWQVTRSLVALQKQKDETSQGDFAYLCNS